MIQAERFCLSGQSSDRTFATQEYDAYSQDTWRLKPNLTLTYGLRWQTSTPVYETKGFEVVPTTPLGQVFELRKQGANKGVPYNDPITLDKGGKFYGKPGFYAQDWNNFGPAIAVAYSPNLGNNWFSKLIGRDGKSSIRGGFRKTFDHIGEQLAVNFDSSNVLGFASSIGLPVNTYNITDKLAPLYTGGIPDVRTLPGIAGKFGTQLNFPLQQPSDQAQRIETSLDSAITTPYNYNYAASYERELSKGLKIQIAYVGRFARNLLAQRDIMQMNNLRDPKSGQTFYEAMNKLIDYRLAGLPINTAPSIPWFENVLPGFAGNVTLNGVVYALTSTQRAYRAIALPKVGPCTVTGTATCGQNSTDYTFKQLQWDDAPIAFMNNIFFHPQYGALSTWSTVAKSNYNSAQVSLTQRFTHDISFDFNYTYGHSLDDASGLQNAGNYSTSALIFNALNPESQYANSDFDVRHIVNANWIFGLPFGRGKTLFHDSGKIVNGILGGWQMTGIFRWNSGAPTASPFGSQRWPTNWQVSSTLVRTKQVIADPSKNVSGQPNLFSDPLATYLSFRDARAGEAGDRNVLRLPGYIDLDAGLYKTFKITERQSVTFRWEVYNVSNTQRLQSPSGFGVAAIDPFLQGQFGLPAITSAPTTFGALTSTQKPLGETKAGRIMQFALRWQF
jgi:hypothetical protein